MLAQQLILGQGASLEGPDNVTESHKELRNAGAELLTQICKSHYDAVLENSGVANVLISLNCCWSVGMKGNWGGDSGKCESELVSLPYQ